MRIAITLLALAATALGQNYVLKAVVLDDGGAPAQSAGYRASFSTGQTVASGWLQSPSYRAVLGFWHGQYEAGIAIEPVAQVPDPMTLVVSPNPLRNRAVVRYTLPRESYVNLQLVDNAGRVVGDLVSSRQSPGSYRINWSVGSASAISAGVYFLRFSGPGSSLVTRVVVAR
jgi:hypothetical protein